MNRTPAPDEISQRTIQLLTGDVNATELDDQMLLIAKCIDHPDELPFLIENIFDLREWEFIDDIRFGLVRIQIDCDLNITNDLEYYQRRQYVAQTIENILFGELLIEGISRNDDDEDKRNNDHRKKKENAHKGRKGGKKARGRRIKE